jgi:hypothetical protein
LTLITIAHFIHLRSEHFLGTAADCLRLDLEYLCLDKGSFFLQVMFQSLSHFFSVSYTLVCHSVECLQSFLVILDTLDEGFFFHLADNRLNVFFDVPFHEFYLVSSLSVLLTLAFLHERLA